MISKLVFEDRKRSCLKWLAGSDLFRGKRSFTFKEGLNILVGPNGSGKSTILNLIGSMMLALDFGVSKVSDETLSRVIGCDSPLSPDKDMTREDFRDGIRPIHDGQPVIYINPDKTFGMGEGGTHFTDPWVGVQNMFARKESSSGEYARIQLRKRFLSRAEPVDLSLTHGDQAKHEALREFWRKPGISEPGQLTILIDEADRSMDLLNQLDTWRFLKLAGSPKGNAQLIVASHCVSAFDIPGAHYIELEKGYRKKCLKKVEKLWEAESEEQK